MYSLDYLKAMYIQGYIEIDEFEELVGKELLNEGKSVVKLKYAPPPLRYTAAPANYTLIDRVLKGYYRGK